jgi:hypothetical protein
MYMWITVDGGETFEGNQDDWADCFFSNPDLYNIIDFCRKHDMQVKIELYPTPHDHRGVLIDDYA